MFKILESSNKVFTLSQHIMSLALQFKVGNQQIKKLREVYHKEALFEIKEFEDKKLK